MDIQAFKIAIKQLDNGWVFEDFSQHFLSARLGYEFIPVGGSGDKGLDGLRHTFTLKSKTSEIFQMSTEITDPKSKIIDTIDKLTGHGKKIGRLTYVTNRKVQNKDTVIDEIYDEKDTIVRIWDVDWFGTNANHSEATVRVYDAFLKNNFHNLSKPGESFVVANLDEESRLYVFLRQQIDQNNGDKKLNEKLIDSLILFHLEPTDPDSGVVISEEQVINYVQTFFKQNPHEIESLVKGRLETISKTKDRKIQNHKQLGGYCLPFQTRKEIKERNLKDIDLENIFNEQTSEKIKQYLNDEEVRVKDVTSLVKETVKTIFYQQGLEFSNFILNGDSESSIEKELVDVVEKVVSNSSIVPPNRPKVQECLIYAIRDIVYNGTKEQKQFLKSLSNTYMMMFLLQWDPKVAIFFESLSNKLNLFIGNSIIIPAFSERFLDSVNKRHWNLLTGAQKAGVKLVVNDAVIDELVSHFEIIRNTYYQDLKNSESFYLEDEKNLTAIDSIMLRSYFYALKRNKISNFDAFLNNFLDPDLKTAKQDLIEILKEYFGIEYLSKSAMDVQINEDVKAKLLEELTPQKMGSTKRAEVDSELILSIYALREKHNESNDTGVFGYKTWWLSKDTSTFRTVKKVLDENFHVSCYMRPDFLYNYIALAPKKEDVEEVYEELFPTLLGVNLSYHLPPNVASVVQKQINDHSELPNARKKSTLRKLTEQLKSDQSLRKKKNLEAFFEKEFAK